MAEGRELGIVTERPGNPPIVPPIWFVRLWLAELDGQIIAGALCFYAKQHVVYWHGAALTEHFRVRIEDVPSEPVEHELSLFMEDTVWPQEGKLEEYVRRSGDHYAVEFNQRNSGRRQLLEIQAAYRTAYGSHQRREVILWQKVVSPKGMVGLLTREIPQEYKTPGRWMVDALELRDQWQSRLLRTSSWSPHY